MIGDESVTLGQDDLVDQLVLGKYLILRHLWEGSLGSLYLGRDESNQPVFVKSISPLHLKSAEAIDSLRRELRKQMRLEHPTIATVVDFGDHDQLQLVVTEYVAGYDLARWHRFVRDTRGDFPVDVAMHIAIELLGALHHAHNATDPEGEPLGIVHRDIMPSNVLIGRDGQPKLTNFGIARIVSHGTAVMDPSMTTALAYLTPELVTAAEPSPASDVYGIGLLLHELLTGRVEFDEGTMPGTLSAVMKREPRPVHKDRMDLPAGLGAVIDRALAKDPAKRFPSATDFADELARLRPSDTSTAAAKLAQLVQADFADPRMAAGEGLSLEERDRLLAEAGARSMPAPPVHKPPRRMPTEQRERAQQTASGEVTMPRGKSSVVWRKAPATAPPPAPSRGFEMTTAMWIGAGVVAAIAVAVIVALLVL